MLEPTPSLADITNVSQSGGSQSQRKKTWLAAILSVIWPGLGQLYAGCVLRGLAICLPLTVVNLIAFRTKIFQVPAGFFVWIVVGIAVLTAVAVDAARQARHRSNSQAPNSRWTVAMISTTILILAVGVFTSRIGLPASSKPFKVPTASMCPTICEGERIMADLEAYKDRPA